jgi:hypothetical protein
MNTISSNGEIGKRAQIPVMPAPHHRTGSGVAADPIGRVDPYSNASRGLISQDWSARSSRAAKGAFRGAKT